MVPDKIKPVFNSSLFIIQYLCASDDINAVTELSSEENKKLYLVYRFMHLGGGKIGPQFVSNII